MRFSDVPSTSRTRRTKRRRKPTFSIWRTIRVSKADTSLIVSRHYLRRCVHRRFPASVSISGQTFRRSNIIEFAHDWNHCTESPGVQHIYIVRLIRQDEPSQNFKIHLDVSNSNTAFRVRVRNFQRFFTPNDGTARPNVSVVWEMLREDCLKRRMKKQKKGKLITT